MTNVYKIIGFIFLCLIIGSGLTMLAETYNIFPIKQKDMSSLINTIWQVHAGVATTSIAILALITGLNKEKKYGYKTLDFMLNISRNKDTLLELDSQNFNKFEENIFILNEILEKVIYESYSPIHSEIYKNLIYYLDLIYVKLIQIGKEEKAIENINKVYKIVNSSNHNNLFLYFYEAMDSLIQSMREYRFSKLIQLPLNRTKGWGNTGR